VGINESLGVGSVDNTEPDVASLCVGLRSGQQLHLSQAGGMAGAFESQLREQLTAQVIQAT